MNDIAEIAGFALAAAVVLVMAATIIMQALISMGLLTKERANECLRKFGNPLGALILAALSSDSSRMGVPPADTATK